MTATPPASVLAVDVGGSHVKFVVSANPAERRRFDSGAGMTARQMADEVLKETADWTYDAVSIGVPAPVRDHRVAAEPMNLGRGWVGFDFEQAFGRPTKVVNDAAMQALGSYDGGKMLFLGLGTGLGSALVLDGKVEPMELAHLPFRKGTFEDYVGERGRRRLGHRKWHAAVVETIDRLSAALEADYVVVGGGNAKRLDDLPADVRIGTNEAAFAGAFRLWDPAAPPA
jgi:predicted NBD/HSP70 family sugar kinase